MVIVLGAMIDVVMPVMVVGMMLVDVESDVDVTTEPVPELVTAPVPVVEPELAAVPPLSVRVPTSWPALAHSWENVLRVLCSWDAELGVALAPQSAQDKRACEMAVVQKHDAVVPHAVTWDCTGSQTESQGLAAVVLLPLLETAETDATTAATENNVEKRIMSFVKCGFWRDYGGEMNTAGT